MVNYVTTSRKPGIRVRSFAKNIAFLFNANYVTRGKSSITDLVSNCRYNGVPFVIVITEQNGNPHQILLLCVTEKSWEIKETFFVNLLVARNELKSNNELRSKKFVYPGQSKTLKWIIKILGVDTVDNSDLEVRDIKNGFSVFLCGKEIGPKFEIRNRESTEKEE